MPRCFKNTVRRVLQNQGLCQRTCLTNVSAEDFGEGSFDKGISLIMPLTYLTGQPSRTLKRFDIRPVTRDGGARLSVNDRLRETLRGYDESGFDAQWGRFWK